MRVTFTGPDTLWLSDDEVAKIVAASGFAITELVSSHHGVSRCAENWAHERGIPVKVIHTNRTMDGKGAVGIQAQLITQVVQAAIVVGKPNHLASLVKRAGKPVFVHRPGFAVVSA
jgi:hypothetical protein